MPTIKMTSSGIDRETTVKEFEVTEEQAHRIADFLNNLILEKRAKHESLIKKIKKEITHCGGCGMLTIFCRCLEDSKDNFFNELNKY